MLRRLINCRIIITISLLSTQSDTSILANSKITSTVCFPLTLISSKMHISQLLSAFTLTCHLAFRARLSTWQYIVIAFGCFRLSAKIGFLTQIEGAYTDCRRWRDRASDTSLQAETTKHPHHRHHQPQQQQLPLKLQRDAPFTDGLNQFHVRTDVTFSLRASWSVHWKDQCERRTAPPLPRWPVQLSDNPVCTLWMTAGTGRAAADCCCIQLILISRVTWSSAVQSFVWMSVTEQSTASVAKLRQQQQHVYSSTSSYLKAFDYLISLNWLHYPTFRVSDCYSQTLSGRAMCQLQLLSVMYCIILLANRQITCMFYFLWQSFSLTWI